MNSPAIYLAAGLVCVATLALALLLVSAFSPWIRAFTAGAPVSVIEILGMRLRGNSPSLLVDAHLALRHSGIRTSIRDVESTYIAHKREIRDSHGLVKLVRDRVAGRKVETEILTPLWLTPDELRWIISRCASDEDASADRRSPGAAIREHAEIAIRRAQPGESVHGHV
jgi:hypothetical protein